MLNWFSTIDQVTVNIRFITIDKHDSKYRNSVSSERLSSTRQSFMGLYSITRIFYSR